MAIDFHEIPSPFYRVAIKALIFDDQNRLLLAEAKDGVFELPGGGWEYDDESLELALNRELREELGVEARQISPVVTTYRAISSRYGSHVLRLVVRAELSSGDFHPGDGLVAVRFATKEEFLALPLAFEDQPARNLVDIIWAPIEKNAAHL